MDPSTVTKESPFRCKIRHIPVKRIFDLLFSTIVIFLGAPLFLAIALSVWFSSNGKVIYSHERIGRGGKPFRCYKFRTMYPDADERLSEILKASPTMKQEWDKKRKLTQDPRITPIGKFLRKSSLDELPQFFNVIKGDLSVVGPRPVVEQEITQHYGLKAGKILSIRPGITGIWQVSGRSDTCYTTRVKLDEKYVEERSIALDLKLICMTVPNMFTKKGAY